MPRPRRARLHASRLPRFLGNGLVVDAVDAQRAFLHHPVDLAVLARAVRTGPRTQLAADALVLVDQHDAVLGALVRSAGGADRDARRRFAVQARAREVQRRRRLRRGRRDFVRMHPVEPDADRRVAVRVLVDQRPGDAAGVPLLARDRAGMAADAGVQVDDEAELARRWRRQRGHGTASGDSGQKRGIRITPSIQKITFSGMPTRMKSVKR